MPKNIQLPFAVSSTKQPTFDHLSLHSIRGIIRPEKKIIHLRELSHSNSQFASWRIYFSSLKTMRKCVSPCADRTHRMNSMLLGRAQTTRKTRKTRKKRKGRRRLQQTTTAATSNCSQVIDWPTGELLSNAPIQCTDFDQLQFSSACSLTCFEFGKNTVKVLVGANATLCTN